MANIYKILNVKPRIKFKTIIPEQYWSYLNVFGKMKQINYHQFVGEKKQNRAVGKKTPTVFWGPLYNISKDELLVLRKTLTEYLDKNFIRINNSPAATPGFFVKKPGGNLRFCVDYRGFNRITEKRIFLPLIDKTFQNIGKTK